MSIHSLHLTGHAIDGSARHNNDSRVSRHMNSVVPQEALLCSVNSMWVYPLC